jgi:hemerythrin superfamily protein
MTRVRALAPYRPATRAPPSYNCVYVHAHTNKYANDKILKLQQRGITMKSEPSDAIALLKADHKKVKDLFEQFDKLSDRSKVNKKKIADQICMELTVHTQVEEEIFYPAVREPIKDDDLMDEAVVEHASAKDLIAQISEMDPGDDLYDAKVKVLSEQIEHHVEEEEGEMFPKVRKTKVDLVALGEQMAARKEELMAGAA